MRTTFIVGFQGETHEEFEDLAEFVKEIEFDRMGCFTYSQEEGTPAARMKDQVEEEEKVRRQELLMESQMRIMERKNQALIGKTLTVLCEGFDRYAECWFGRSEADAPEVDGKVFFTHQGKKPMLGQFVPVTITDTMDCDLIGEMDG